MKKLTLSILCIVLLLISAIGLVACNKEQHTHDFTEQVAEDKYLASEATCTEPAKYYYSCACGKKGAETFQIGDALGHSYSIEWSFDETYHWHAATCEHDVEVDRAAHTFGENNVCSVCKFNRASTLSGIYLSKQTLTLDVGKTETLLATVLPVNMASVTLTWISTAPSVAIVQNGTVTAIAKGTATIIANCGEVSATCTVSVTDPCEDFNFSLVDGGYAVIAYSGNQKEVTVPSAYNGKSVISIGNFAFSNCVTLTGVTIPNSVTIIGSQAFSGCRSLSNIVMDGVRTIGNNAFQDCKSLASVTIPSGVTLVGNNAFSGCRGLKSIEIPNSVTSIGEYAFSGCSNLTSVIWNAENCTLAGSGANPVFRGCTNLSTVTIGDNVKTIPSNAFYNCSGLKSIELPDSVTSIGGSAFSGCSGLTSIEIPNSVTSIGSNAFCDCSGLRSVTIGNDVTSISWNAFWRCSGLTNVVWNAENCTSAGSESSPIFNDCTNLSTVTIGNNVKTIPDYAFYKCYNLTSVIWNAENCTLAGSGANPVFMGCTNLSTVTIGDNVKTIPSQAFYGCSGLTSVTIPDSVTSIGSSAFSGCDSLVFTEYNDAYYLGNRENPYLALIKAISTDIIKCAINPKCKFVYDRAFNNCRGLTEISIPSSVTSIGDRAFSRCSGLERIEVSADNTVYHSDGNCLIKTASKTLILGRQNSVIPTDGSVTSIGEYAFFGCSGLTSIEIPSSVTTIDSGVFYGCSGLASIEIPSSVTSIGDYAFLSCSNLRSINYTDTKEKWNAITKGYAWNKNTGNYTIRCTDGDISK